LLELSRNGRHDEACRLVNLRTVPSWGFMIDMGATTIWERWDGYVKGRGFQNPGMNSFNHWAFGSVGEWVWREIVGIQPDEERPGYEHFFIRPGPADGFTWARGTYGSIRGPITSSWRVEGGTLTLEVTVPCNATATVYVPTTNPAQVTERGRPAGQSEGVRPLAAEPGAAVFHVQSGHYTFSASIAPRQDE